MHKIAILARYTPYKCTGPVYGDFSVFTSCYAHMYYVPRYISQPRPSQRPQSRGSNSEPKDGHRTIPSNEEILS